MTVLGELPGLDYRRLAGAEGGAAPFSSSTIAPGNGSAATIMRNLIDTRCGAPANASSEDKAQAFASKMNAEASKHMVYNLANVMGKCLVVEENGEKREDFDREHPQFKLSKDADGNIKISTVKTDSVAQILSFDEQNEPVFTNVKAGSGITYSMDITLPKDNLYSLANADWSQYDYKAVNQYVGDMDGRVAMIPEQFRFTGTVNYACHFHLNE